MTRHTLGWLAVALAALLLLFSRLQQPLHATDHGRFHQADVTVTEVVEGDLLRVITGREVTNVRLLGSDAFGRSDALDRTKAAIDDAGGTVRLYLEDVPTRNAAGELLAYVFLGDDLLNEQLVAAGVAFTDRRFEYSYRQHFERLEHQAAARRLGVWTTFPDVPDAAMPEWRRRWLAEQRKEPWNRSEWRRADEP